MYRIPLMILMVFVLGILSASSAERIAAQGEPTPTSVVDAPFYAHLTIQNLSLDRRLTLCTLRVYDEQGAERYSVDFVTPSNPIPAQGNTHIYTPIEPDFPTGAFGGVVNCNEPVEVAIDFSNNLDGLTSASAYTAIGRAGGRVLLPGAYNNYFAYNTSFRIQNIEATPTKIKVSYYDSGPMPPPSPNPTPTPDIDPTNPLLVRQDHFTLAGHASIRVDQQGLPELQPDRAYAAEITAESGRIAAVGIIYGGQNGLELYTSRGFAEGHTRFYVPMLMREVAGADEGYNTSTTIQNASDQPAQVRMIYNQTGATAFDARIPPKAAQVLLDFEDLDPGIQTSATIESDQPVAVMVNMSNSTSARATSYPGFPAHSASQQVLAPIVLRDYYDFDTEIVCQNVADPGGASTTVEATFITDPSQPGDNIQVTASPRNIRPGATAKLDTRTIIAMNEGFLGSGILCASQPIVCLVFQDEEDPQRKDALLTYPAIGIAGACQE